MTDTRSLVYDAPTRLFHWLFAGLFVTTYSIANLADDSPAFPLHMLAGMLLGCLVLLRLVWGLVGSQHARFGSFAFAPRSLLAYFRGMFTGGGEKWAGHNPASSWAAVIMMALAGGLVVTGLLMANGNAEAYEDVHELLANSFLVIALLHVAGVALHVLRHRDGFPKSMVDGRKPDVPEAVRIGSARGGTAVVMAGAMLFSAFILWKGYDPSAQTLTTLGMTLQLGEQESASAEHGEGDDD